jgi:hypothetical protein
VPRIAGRPVCRVLTTASLAAAAALGPAGAAHAQSAAGGAFAGPAPRVAGFECRTVCSGPAYARTGSTVVLRGRNLDGVEDVTFLGAKAAGDEVTADPERVVVVVPARAAGGRIIVKNADGAVSRPSPSPMRIESVATRRVSSGPGPAIDIAVSGRRVFFDGERQATLTYVLHDQDPVHAIVQVIRVADGAVVAQFDQGPVAADEQRIVSWDGTSNGAVAPEGRYQFAVVAESSTGVIARSAQAAPAPADAPRPPDSFVLLAHKFPVRGKHDFGRVSAAFGGGRGHQGQDVFAACGTPLVAARGGVVKFKRFQSRAGNYVVVDAEQSDVDQVYMHLRDAALVDQGDRVRTGQLIGYVGSTGRADGCHLHFEEWTGPGWYTGGSAFDPLPDLQAWDKLS